MNSNGNASQWSSEESPENNTTTMMDMWNITVTSSPDSMINSSNATEIIMVSPSIDQTPEAVIVPIVFALIFVIGVVGNGTLCYTVLRHKSLRNVPNIYVVSLGVGDLLLLLLSAPFSATLYTFNGWPYGEITCKFNEYMQTVSVGVSVFTLTALSGDRYLAIVDPMSKHMGKPTLKTVAVVTLIWIVSLILAVPDAVSANLTIAPSHHGNNTFIDVCLIYPREWPDWYARYHTLFRFIIFFLVPMMIIGIFYLLMARILVKSSREIPCEQTKGGMNHQQRQIEARLKVAKVVLSFVIIFIICWLPRHIYLFWYHFDESEYNMFWHVFKIAGFCFTYIYCCVNPYALYFLSSQFRKYYQRYLFCCCPDKRYRNLDQPTSSMYNFNSTVRRASTSMTIVQSQSMC